MQGAVVTRSGRHLSEAVAPRACFCFNDADSEPSIGRSSLFLRMCARRCGIQRATGALFSHPRNTIPPNSFNYDKQFIRSVLVALCANVYVRLRHQNADGVRAPLPTLGGIYGRSEGGRVPSLPHRHRQLPCQLQLLLFFFFSRKLSTTLDWHFLLVSHHPLPVLPLKTFFKHFHHKPFLLYYIFLLQFGTKTKKILYIF